MILLVGNPEDRTFRHTLVAIKNSGSAFVHIDPIELIVKGTLRIPYENLLESELGVGQSVFRLGQFRSVWVRLPDVTSGAPTHLREASRAASIALYRLFSEVRIPVMNRVLRNVSNASKVFHAVNVGIGGPWQMPRSCLTNDSLRAEKFIKSCSSGVIFKGASAAKTWATIYRSDLHAARLPLLVHAPVLFQELIAGIDVRVHVVGGASFAEAIESPDIDYRVGRDVRYKPLVLPPLIANGCVSVARKLQAPLVGVDFKVTAPGKWFFLEANNMPCYEGYDRRAGGAIAREIVVWLSSAGEA